MRIECELCKREKSVRGMVEGRGSAWVEQCEWKCDWVRKGGEKGEKRMVLRATATAVRDAKQKQKQKQKGCKLRVTTRFEKTHMQCGNTGDADADANEWWMRNERSGRLKEARKLNGAIEVAYGGQRGRTSQRAREPGPEPESRELDMKRSREREWISSAKWRCRWACCRAARTGASRAWSPRAPPSRPHWLPPRATRFHQTDTCMHPDTSIDIFHNAAFHSTPLRHIASRTDQFTHCRELSRFQEESQSRFKTYLFWSN